jgi:transposase
MNKQLELFPSQEYSKDHTPAEKIDAIFGKPRIVKANRFQYEFKQTILDAILPKEHLARDVWNYVEKLDLSIALNEIQSVEGSSGRSAIDPKILLSLWLFATIKRVNSARMIEEYSREHDAYKWICGGVNVNYHTISDFRSNYKDQLDSLLTQSVAVLSSQGIISLEEISQDGMRVRASAGSSSFRKEGTLQDHLILADMLINDLNEETKKNPMACKTRVESARRRSIEEKKIKVEQALEELNKLRSDKEAVKKKYRTKLNEEDKNKMRASVTDPQSRIMKMPCMGFRPAFNVQFATTNVGKAIVGVSVINRGSDSRETLDMMNQIKNRFNADIKGYYVDSGYDVHLDIDEIEDKFTSCKTYMPPKYKNKMKNSKSQPVHNLLDRMESEEGKEAYKMRAETAEFSNAQSRNKGLQQFLVRGLDKASCVTLIYAIAHNMQILFSHS